MAHGSHGKHREAARRPNKGLALQQSDKQKTKKKSKMASIKNQMRSIQRLLQKSLSAEVKDAQHKRLEDLKKQAEQNQQAELERKMSLRYRRVKFFERRKIERAIKQIEKLQEAGLDISESAQKLDTTKQLAQLKEDLEYVRFFPKTEKYISLFMGNDDEEVIAKRSKLREQIKANLAAAAVTGVEPDEMENDEDRVMEVSDDDFFLAGSSNDDAEADDQQNLTALEPGALRGHTAKMMPASTARHTSGHKTHQQHQRQQENSSSSSQFRNQRPQSTGRSLKIKGSQFRDERHQFQTGNNKNKKQKTTMNPPPLGSPFPSHSRSQPAFNTTFKIASSALSSKNNASRSNVHSSFINSDTSKVLPIPQVDSSNMDVQKKRRRKHRPKRKKT